MTQFLQHSVSLSTDIIAICVLFILLFAYGMYFGKSYLVSLVLTFYPARFLFEHFPFVDKLIFLKGDMLLTLNKVGIFILFLIPVHILIGRYVFSESGYGAERMFRTAGLAIAGVISVLVFNYGVINLDLLYNFTPVVDVLFSGADKLFYWSLAPLVILFVL